MIRRHKMRSTINGTPVQQGPSYQNVVDHESSVQPFQRETASAVLPPILTIHERDVNNGLETGMGDNSNGCEGLMHQRLSFELDDQLLRTRPATADKKQGSFGEKMNLLANYFPIRTSSGWTILQYRVDFGEDIEEVQVRRQLIEQQRDKIGSSYYFDGVTIFSAKTITSPNKPLCLVGSIERGNRLITINIKYVGYLERGHHIYFQVFNMLTRRCLEKLNLQPSGRNMFDPHDSIKMNQFKIEIWPGYLTSIRQHDGGIMMNCEFTSKVIRRNTAYDILISVSGSDRNQTMEAYRRAMLGQTVVTPYDNKTYKIDDIDFDLSPESTFETANGQRFTYIAYYLHRYNRAIQSRSQPLLISRAKTRGFRTGKSSSLCLIPELCVMTGLTRTMKEDFYFMKELDGLTKLNPIDRAKRLVGFNQRLYSKPEIIEEFSGWGLVLSNNFVEVPSRVLKPEDIICGNKEIIKPDENGDWTKFFQTKKMLVPEAIKRWVLICPQKYNCEAAYFVSVLMVRAVHTLEIELEPPEMYYVDDDNSRALVDAVDSICAKRKPNMIMAILCNGNEEKYNAFKKKCYVDRAVLSQVVLAKNLTHKYNAAIAMKVAIQMSCKLGGAAWGLVDLPGGVMVVGIDVCHDNNGKKKSYGALVATQNATMTNWFSTVMPHKSVEELSNTISTEITKALQGWYENNGCLPQRIIIYRDGVGDGQLQQVFHHEVPNIQKTLTHLYQGDGWKMACIVVTKCVNTRFFTVYGQNPLPGTVVDDVVTQPERYDFFLVTKSVRTGTASPTLYNVIADNTGWSPNHLHYLSFKLTHLYYNVSSSVRVPAPCKYAHKLAYLVSHNLHAPPHPQLARKLYYL